MIPKFPDFIDFFSVAPKNYLDLVSDFEPYSDFNFVSVFSWNVTGSCSVSLLNENLVLSMKDYLGDEQILTFIGKKHAAETAKTLLNYAHTQPGYKKQLELIPKVVADKLQTIDGLTVYEDHANHDYILSASDSRDFAGRRFLRKRQHLNKFTNLYGNEARLEQLDINDKNIRKEILDLDLKWNQMGSDGAKDALNESFAMKKILDDYRLLSSVTKLECIGLFVKEEMVAFIIYEITGEHVITHFAKSDLALLYSSEFLLASLLRQLDKDHNIDIVNIEQDLGIPGLREHKMGHSPSRFLQKYTVAVV
jgi:hypothetical protein